MTTVRRGSLRHGSVAALTDIERTTSCNSMICLSRQRSDRITSRCRDCSASCMLHCRRTVLDQARAVETVFCKNER